MKVPGCYRYILLPDQRLLDPETEDIVGTFNRETSEIDLQNPTLLQQVGSLKELGSDPTIPNDGEPLDIHEYIERGNQMVKAGRFKAAAGLFSEALNACSSARAVDLDLETDIIKSRATRFVLRKHEKACFLCCFMYIVYEVLDPEFVFSGVFCNWSPDVDRCLNKNLKSQTYTLNPKPLALNPKPQALNP